MARKKVGRIKRQQGKMYFVNRAGDVVETDLNRKGRKKGTGKRRRKRK